MRVLIAVTHLLGAGHLTRAAAIARALAAAGHDVTLVSGGAPARLVRLDGVRLVPLSPLHVDGTRFQRLLDADGAEAGPATLDARRRRLLDTLDETAPDVVVTELFPFGRRALAAEFLALVETARLRRPRPVILASIRDILVAPSKPGRIADAHERIARLYDGVLVHGDPALVPLAASWPVDAALRATLHNTGYVDEGGTAVAGPRAGILVSAGSSAAGLDLLRAAAGAARLAPDLGWRILAGHGVPQSALADIGAGLRDGVMERARPDYRALLAGAALSVSACGYNTAVDLLRTGTRAVLVPFEAGHETEQRLRADRLAMRGLARVLPEAELAAKSLLESVLAALAGPEPAPHGIDLDGAARSVAIIEGFVRGRPVAAPSLRPRRADLRIVKAALDAAAGRGVAVPIWWRDDDAVAATPALDRLLALASAFDAPLLIAAIPASAEPSLADRLGRAPGISVAVHGLSHADHAPHGEKAAEFGDHRPLAALRREAAEALRIARQRLPEETLLPVFVPPWNRVSPALAAALPELGYLGLSAVEGPPVAGLVRADIHLDPIAWRGNRSLVDPDVLAARLVQAMAGDPERGVARKPLGLLTHHRVHDAAIWAFLDDLLALLLSHPAVRLRDPRDLFGPPAVDVGAGPWPSRADALRARSP